MSETETASSDQQSIRVSRTAWKVVAALVLMRVCLGWHFFSEGAKKVTYDRGRQTWTINVPTAAVLGQAKGPLAEFYHSQIPGGHGWQSMLAVPVELTPESNQQLTDWITKYVKRRKGEIKSGKHKEVEIPEFSPYADWAKQIRADWKAILTQLTNAAELSEEQGKRAAEAFEKRERDLADYLAEECLEIQAYQHELWRLKKGKN